MIGRALAPCDSFTIPWSLVRSVAAQLGAPHVPVLNLVSLQDPFFGATGSVAADVAAPGGGYGETPSGSCARQMRAQGVPGASIRLMEPYHDTLEQTGSLYRYLVAKFVRAPPSVSAAGVLSFEGKPLSNTLCDAERCASAATRSRGVRCCSLLKGSAERLC